jgi:hypothetical protein
MARGFDFVIVNVTRISRQLGDAHEFSRSAAMKAR